MPDRNLLQIWNQLRGQKPQRRDFLEELRIQGFRGIRDLRVPLSYPVSVLAGPNGTGKSTVLFALACAYESKYPSALFPNFKAKDETLPADAAGVVQLDYAYLHEGERLAMRWSRGKKWNHSFFGKKGATWPRRDVYLRTLANLSNPSEVRSILQMGLHPLAPLDIDASNLAFAHRILPFGYRRLTRLSRAASDSDELRTLLFAERAGDPGATVDGASYSEFHMSAGERAVLRISLSLSKLRNALILIDEVETGLHPFTQQQLLLELQRLALRNELQIVVTTHSPVVLDSVPNEARIFLERSGDNVILRPPYRDVLQRALYGQSKDSMSVLCEDEAAEFLLRGILDHVNPRLDLAPSDIEVGRDTGKDEFPAHLAALAKFKLLRDVVFVLDGDAATVKTRLETDAQRQGQLAQVLLLPGEGAPEGWAWERLQERPDHYAEKLGMTPGMFRQMLENIHATFAGAADTPANIAKGRMQALADQTARQTTDIMRAVGRSEAARDDGTLVDFITQFEQAVQGWRAARD